MEFPGKLIFSGEGDGLCKVSLKTFQKLITTGRNLGH